MEHQQLRIKVKQGFKILDQLCRYITSPYVSNVLLVD